MDERAVFLDRFRTFHTDSGLAPNNALALLLVKLKGLDILACVFDDEEIEDLIELLRNTVVGNLHCEDKIFRINKDVFALILPGLLSRELMRIVTHKLLAVIDRPHTIEGKPVHLRGHIGITFIERSIESGKEAIKQAHTALFDACESNRPFVIYTDQQTELADFQISLSNEIEEALDRCEFFLEYQPQLDLESGRIAGAEALIRWENAKHGRVRPDRFIPLAEKRGMSVRISEWVIDNAMRFQSELGLADLDMTLSVNLAPGDLMNAFLPDYIDQSLSIWNVNPDRLVLEITEGSMIQSIKTVLPLLRALKGMGVELSIDDFGTGYSSLKYIQELPVGELKLDQSFVKNLPWSRADRNIVRTVASLAKNFQFKTVAEGIESKEALQFLVESGYHKIQGYYLSRPLSETDFIQYARKFNSGEKK